MRKIKLRRIKKFIGLKCLEIGGLLLFIFSLKYIGKGLSYVVRGIINLGKFVDWLIPLEPYQILTNTEFFILGICGIGLSILLLGLIWMWIVWNWDMAGR